MNGYLSRRRLVAVAMCLSVLVVVGIGYAAIDADTCQLLEKTLVNIEAWQMTCGERNDCDVWNELQGQYVCAIDTCWDIVDGVCFLPAV